MCVGYVVSSYFVYFLKFFIYKMSTNIQRLTYHQKNKDVILKKAKEYYQKNREKLIEY